MIANVGNASINKKNVLRNAYYLCGYVFEGLINYSIFFLLEQNNIWKNGNVMSLNGKNPLKIETNSSQLKYLVFFEDEISKKLPSNFALSRHKFQDNLNLLQELDNFGNLFEDIPIIATNEDIENPNVITLFNTWEHYVRYQLHPDKFPYNEKVANFDTKFERDISDLVRLARVVYDRVTENTYNWKN